MLLYSAVRMQEGVEVLQPHIRTFSELPGWLASNRQRLAHKRVLMYCTGGVRCERASAYVRSLGDAFQDVHQLEGAPDLHLGLAACCMRAWMLQYWRQRMSWTCCTVPHGCGCIAHRQQLVRGVQAAL